MTASSSNEIYHQPFYEVTLSFSEAGVPTICIMLPMYKAMEGHLASVRAQCEVNENARVLLVAIDRAQAKLQVHMDKALAGKYPILGTGTAFFCPLIMLCLC